MKVHFETTFKSGGATGCFDYSSYILPHKVAFIRLTLSGSPGGHVSFEGSITIHGKRFGGEVDEWRVISDVGPFSTGEFVPFIGTTWRLENQHGSVDPQVHSGSLVPGNKESIDADTVHPLKLNPMGNIGAEVLELCLAAATCH